MHVPAKKAPSFSAGKSLKDYMANKDSYAIGAFSSEGNNEVNSDMNVFRADGHYKFDAAGPADSVNEIWPGFTTNPSGIGVGFAQNAGVADASALSVVVHGQGGAKIACADLK